MDPDANLREQRHLILRIHAGKAEEGDAERLADLAQALDDWLKSGGDLPGHWRRDERSGWRDYVMLQASNDGQAFERGKNAAIAVFRAHECYVARRRYEEDRWATEDGPGLVGELFNRWTTGDE